MTQEKLETLRAHTEALARIQGEIEEILAEEKAYKRTLQRKTEIYDRAELICESLEYVVDDLDSVLGNLEDITSNP